jgi:hypothetical protein
MKCTSPLERVSRGRESRRETLPCQETSLAELQSANHDNRSAGKVKPTDARRSPGFGSGFRVAGNGWSGSLRPGVPKTPPRAETVTSHPQLAAQTTSPNRQPTSPTPGDCGTPGRTRGQHSPRTAATSLRDGINQRRQIGLDKKIPAILKQSGRPDDKYYCSRHPETNALTARTHCHRDVTARRPRPAGRCSRGRPPPPAGRASAPGTIPPGPPGAGLPGRQSVGDPDTDPASMPL